MLLQAIRREIESQGPSVACINEALTSILATSEKSVADAAGDSEAALRDKLVDANRNWELVVAKADNKWDTVQKLVAATESFSNELQELHDLLAHYEQEVGAFTPIGSLGEHAAEQLARFGETHAALMGLKERLERVEASGTTLEHESAAYSDAIGVSVEQDLGALEARWSDLKHRADEKRARLESCAQLSSDFHRRLELLTHFLADADKELSQIPCGQKARSSVSDSTAGENTAGALDAQLQRCSQLREQLQEKKPELHEIDRLGNTSPLARITPSLYALQTM